MIWNNNKKKDKLSIKQCSEDTERYADRQTTNIKQTKREIGRQTNEEVFNTLVPTKELNPSKIQKLFLYEIYMIK